MKTEKSLNERWKSFINIIFDPWIILLTISVVILICLSLKDNDNELIKSTLIVLISIISSLLGGIFAKRWGDITEEKILVTRGESAIRSLKLLILNISQIEKRISVYIERLNKDSQDYALMKNHFEEIIEKCNILEEESINSIENWTDIIPEANIKTQIGILSELKKDKESLFKQIEELHKELSDNNVLEKKEKDKLNDIIKQKTKDLQDVQSKLLKKETEINTSVLSGMTWNIPINIDNPYLKPRNCIKCGKELEQKSGDIVYSVLCPECLKQ